MIVMITIPGVLTKLSHHMQVEKMKKASVESASEPRLLTQFAYVERCASSDRHGG